MWTYVARKLLYNIPVYLGILLFLMLALRVNDPAYAFLGKNATEADLLAIREKLGLDQPFWRQYLDVLSFDFSIESWANEGLRVSDMLAGSVGPSLAITVPALALTSTISISIAIISAYFRGRPVDRTLMVLQRNGVLPKLPKGIVSPQIVAGVNALGRGSDRESLIQFITTIAQTMGPEAITQFINSDEYIKRLATAQGIETLNLVKSMETVQQEQQDQMQQQQAMELTKQAGQFASSPMADPSKNPQLSEMMNGSGETQETPA